MVSETCKGISTVLGCFLIHITLGTLYTCANINAYIISYLYRNEDVVIQNNVSAWLFSAAFIGLAATNMLGGLLEKKIGLKITVAISCLVASCSVIVCYWLVHNYYAIIAVFGCLFGLGAGVAYSPLLGAGIKWFPSHSGLVSGIIAMGFGAGALIFNNVQTLILNPENLPAEKIEQFNINVYPQSVCDRVPMIFVILGCTYLVIQIIGLLLIHDPKEINKTPAIHTPVSDGKEITAMKNSIKEGLSVSAAMKTWKFWEMFIFLFLVCQVVLFISSFYKSIAQNTITDDQFIALIGSISSLCNGVFRPIWGTLYDLFGYKIMMSIACVLLGAFIGTLILVPSLGQYTYMLWVCIIYIATGGVYAMLPSYVGYLFGSLNVSSIYGWIFLSEAFSGLFYALCATLLLGALGYDGLSYCIAGIMLICLLLVLFGQKWTFRDDPKFKTHLPLSASKVVLDKPATTTDATTTTTTTDATTTTNNNNATTEDTETPVVIAVERAPTTITISANDNKSFDTLSIATPTERANVTTNSPQENKETDDMIPRKSSISITVQKAISAIISLPKSLSSSVSSLNTTGNPDNNKVTAPRFDSADSDLLTSLAPESPTHHNEQSNTITKEEANKKE
ncbi:hypothetical protein WA158_006292 [Blastocystis sp. Blastoise]